jgi:predicted transposase YdaD
MLLGIRGIEESTVYQGILRKGEAKGRIEGRREGEVEHARKTLLRQGAKKLGLLDERIEAELTAMSDLDRLNELIDRVLDVSTWEELLSPPDPSA